jgi:hypothetical protein
MKRRMYALLSLIVALILAYLIWEYVPTGSGLMRNVLRNMLLAALVPVPLWALAVLFGKQQQPAKGRKGPQDKHE